MDGSYFDSLTRAWISTGSRRRALGSLLAGALALLGGQDLQDVAAHNKKKHCKKKSGNAKKKCLKKARKHAQQHAATGGGGSTSVQCIGPILPPCPSGTTCQSNEICFNGECIEDSSHLLRPCTSSADCPAENGWAGCYNGRCRRGPCPQNCGTFGGCVTANDGVTSVCLDCTSDTDCHDLYPHCVENRCVRCAVDAHCSPGEVCRGGDCYSGCGSAADCPAPEYVSCYSGACIHNRHKASCHIAPSGGSGGA